MKLMCNVLVFNRLSTFTSNDNRRNQRSCLAIGKQSEKKDVYNLLLQTQTNKAGTKYKINDNIEQVFTKFVNEGKATIRLKEPPHDISIQCDSIQLKSFLHVLKLAFSKKLDASTLTLSNLSSKNIITAPKTKLVIKQISDYPVLAGFPRSIEELHIAGFQRRSFDRQILKLQNLRILNLSQNQLTSVPQELGNLPNLQELNLSENLLGKSPMSKWAWLSGKIASKNLRLLNLSSNQICIIPDQIKKLDGLITLYLNNNSISKLPQGIGSLNKLKYLFLSKNNLMYLPGNMRNLRLMELDISENPFVVNSHDMISTCNIKVPSLVEVSAQVVLRCRIYYDSSIIPFTLVQYLDKAFYCMCGAPCFDCYLRKFITMSMSIIARSIRFSGEQNILFDCYFCSIKCLRKYYKNF